MGGRWEIFGDLTGEQDEDDIMARQIEEEVAREVNNTLNEEDKVADMV